jgi:hypothetical protein
MNNEGKTQVKNESFLGIPVPSALGFPKSIVGVAWDLGLKSFSVQLTYPPNIKEDSVASPYRSIIMGHTEVGVSPQTVYFLLCFPPSNTFNSYVLPEQPGHRVHTTPNEGSTVDHCPLGGKWLLILIDLIFSCDLVLSSFLYFC